LSQPLKNRAVAHEQPPGLPIRRALYGVCVGVTSTVLVEVVVDVVASGVPEGLGISRVVDVSVVVVASFFWQPSVRAPAPRIRKPARVRILFMAILLKKGGPSGRILTFATSVPHPILTL
jgi:hypothetical protein